MAERDLLDTALYVAVEEGWHVFPVRLEDDPTNPGKKLKKPLIQWGSGASVSEQAIEAMPWSRANAIGIACGPSGLCVIDVDPAADEETRRRLAKLPPTWEQATPRGRHLVYRAPRAFEQRNTTGAPYPGIDIRGDGGYIVLYAGIDQLPAHDSQIAPWPLKTPVGKRKEEPVTIRDRPSLDLLAPLPRPGERNHWLASSAGKLVSLGFSSKDIATLLIPLAADLGISERECRATFLRSTVEWIAEREPAQEVDCSCKSLAQLFEEEEEDEPQPLPGLLPYGMTILAGAPKAGKSWLGLQLSYALGSGQSVLGVSPETAEPVAFYAVEDSWKQLRSRVRLLPDGNAQVDFFLSMPSGKAGVEHLQGTSHRIIVIDTGVRALGAPAEYAEIQRLYGPLQSWAKRNDRAVLILWHTSKPFIAADGRTVDKGMDAIMGSRGLVAVADAMWLLAEGVMAVEGRDIIRDSLIVSRDGDSPWLNRDGGGGVESTIVDLLRQQGGIGLLPSAILPHVSCSDRHLRRTLQTLVSKGWVEKIEDGKYVAKRLRQTCG
ncbi:MAG: bifunctional DNA primase/polymerase [Chromatiaceae bacterium]|nr:bifunctional DNA primase/polymerase [Candidatus Thioaporhodococcus sediminis]